MLLELNKFEKRASVFLLLAVLGLTVAFIYIAYKKSWFEAKNDYYAIYEKSSGIHPGTAVTIAGITAGKVTDIILDDKNQIEVHFQILKRFESKIREDSIAKIVRPFIIGDKVIDITVGELNKKIMPRNSQLKGMESMELIDFISGDQIGPYLDTLKIAIEKLKTILDELLVNADEKSIVAFTNELLPTLKAFKGMAKLMSDNDMQKLIKNSSKVTEEVSKADIKSLIKNMEILSADMAKVSGKFPDLSEKAIKTLDEGVWVLKGMQDSWFLRDHIEKERQKEAAKTKASAAEKK